MSYVPQMTMTQLTMTQIQTQGIGILILHDNNFTGAIKIFR